MSIMVALVSGGGDGLGLDFVDGVRCGTRTEARR